jgi:hypothetical protein
MIFCFLVILPITHQKYIAIQIISQSNQRTPKVYIFKTEYNFCKKLKYQKNKSLRCQIIFRKQNIIAKWQKQENWRFGIDIGGVG